MAIYESALRLIGGKIEAVSGTPEATLEYDVRFRTGELSDLSVDFADDAKVLDGTMNVDSSTPTIARATIGGTFQVARGEITDNGGTFDYNYPFSKYFEGAGLLATENDPVVGTSEGWVEWTPSIDKSCQTMTVGLIDNSTCNTSTGTAIEYKISGAINTLTIGADDSAQPIMATISCEGAVAGVNDLATVPTYDPSLATNGIRFVNTMVKITRVNNDGSDGGYPSYEACVSNFTFDTGNTLSEVLCSSSEYGLKQKIITDRLSTLAVNPLMSKLADFDWWGGLNQAHIYKVELVAYSDATNTKKDFEIIIPRAQIVTNSITDDNGMLRNEQTFNCLVNLQGSTAEEKEKSFKLIVYGNTL